MNFLCVLLAVAQATSASQTDLASIFHQEGCVGVQKHILATKEENRTWVQKLYQANCVADPIEAAPLYRNNPTFEAKIALAQRNYLMGNYAVSVKDFEEARKLIMEGASKNPVIADTLEYWYALSLYASGKQQLAETKWKKLYSKRAKVCEQGFSCVADVKMQSLAPVVMARIYALDSQKKWEEASFLIEKYLKKTSEEIAIRWVLELRLQLGNFYFRQQKTRQAYMQFARVLRFYPQSAQALWLKDHYAANDILKKYGSKVSSLQ